MKLAVITLDEQGSLWTKAMSERFPNLVELRSGRDGELKELFREAFCRYEGLICCMACGIVVRMIAPLVKNKLTDPAVVVLDDGGRWAVSLLSGHEGGANALAYEAAALVGAEAVITTGTETKKRVILGVGCRRGIEAEAVISAVTETLALGGYTSSLVRVGASIRLKAREPGLLEAFTSLGIPLVFIDEERINTFNGPYQRSEAAILRAGVRAVAEPCALLAGRRTRLVVPKRRYPGLTVAVALEE